MQIFVVGNYEALSKQAALFVAERIREKQDLVLGCSTGETPLGLYRELMKLTKAGELNFDKVRVFNLDEYCDLAQDDPQSHAHYMQVNLLKPLNVRSENGFLISQYQDYPFEYERAIEKVGGIDLQILGIGRNGHIGFNEPGSSFDSDTRVVDLTDQTIADNSRFFKNPSVVPRRAITMGLATIMAAREILLLASGVSKAAAVKQVFDGRLVPEVPASILQKHAKVTVILDREVAKGLKKV